jgi:hypothetical protein
MRTTRRAAEMARFRLCWPERTGHDLARKLLVLGICGMCLCVCVYVYICVCYMSACMYVLSAYICIYMHTCIHMNVYMYVCK